MVRSTESGVEQCGSQPLLFTNCVTLEKYIPISILYPIFKVKLIIESTLQRAPRTRYLAQSVTQFRAQCLLGGGWCWAEIN